MSVDRCGLCSALDCSDPRVPIGMQQASQHGIPTKKCIDAAGMRPRCCMSSVPIQSRAGAEEPAHTIMYSGGECQTRGAEAQL